MMKFQKTISAVTATTFLWGALGFTVPSASAQGKGLRPTSPVAGLPAASATGTPAAGAPAGAPVVVAAGAKPTGATGNPVDDLPLPGEKEFTECRAFPADKKVGITLKPETELMELVGWIKTISCRPFILPSNIRQSKVTIIAPQLVTAGEAYRIFLSALEAMGLTVQPDGRVLKIIESNHARESPIPVITPGDTVPRTEQYVTRMLRLKYITTDEVVQVLSRLKGRDGDITPYSTTNTLIITDLASNIRRMEEVVRALDVAMSGEKIWVIRLRNIVATEVATMLQQVFNIGKATTPGQPRRAPLNVPLTGSTDASFAPAMVASGDDSISQIYPDDRTNSLIVVASERTYQRVFALIKRLETQGSTATGDRIHVYALENANAEDIAQVLSGIVTVVGGGGSRGSSSSSTAARGRQSAPTGGGGQGTAGLFQDEVKITPDKATNSLVILAGSKDYLVVRKVIRDLDIPRRQVFVETAIMEVNLAMNRDLGVSYHAGTDVPGLGGVVLGGLQGTTLKSLNPSALLGLSGLLGGVIGPQFTNPSVFGAAAGTALPPQFGLLIQAMQTNSDVNVMQVPNILTTDNEKATITVGQNLPFQSAISSIGGTGGLGGIAPLASVQRQDVQLKLEITPHVNASDYVRLEIDNEISDVTSPNYNNLGPATSKRTLKTTAVVRDQQPVVLGGIMKDSVSETVTKIPILGDIPILGYLFKTREKATTKQLLLIVLTPYIINDPSDLQRIFERKTRERREFIEAYGSFTNEKDITGPIDYTRKRGALEEINRTAVEAEREMVELRAADQSLNREVIDAGPVELPLSRTPISAPALPPPPSVPSSAAGGTSSPPTTPAPTRPAPAAPSPPGSPPQ